MSAKKKMTAKKKATKRKPREWMRWAVLEGNGRFWTTTQSRAEAIAFGCPGDDIIRVRITEIVK